jgi:hypothetical protein
MLCQDSEEVGFALFIHVILNYAFSLSNVTQVKLNQDFINRDSLTQDIIHNENMDDLSINKS